jgi:hypothetical protein
MTPAEVAITAAFGASLLTGLASLGVVWLQGWRHGKANDKDALHAAVAELLTRSMGVSMRAATMRTTIRFRSGLGEGWDVTFRYRKPLDPLELHDWQAQDMGPLNAALSEVWTRWDQEGIRLANDLVNKCVDLSDASVALAPADTARQRLRKQVVGERWTPEMEETYDCAVKAMAHSRKSLADYARAKLKMDTVDLFAQVELPDDHDAVTSKPEAIQPERAAEDGPSAVLVVGGEEDGSKS